MKKVFRVITLVLAVVMIVTALTGCGAKKKDSYLIYSDNAFAPFEYYDNDTKQYVGLDMDILAAIAEDQNFKYDIKNEGFDASMGAVQSGQADGMIAGMTINEEREKTYDFADGYFEDGQIFVLPADSTITDYEGLRGTVVAAKTSTESAKFTESISEEYGFTVQYYEDSPTMYTAVINGVNSACFEDRSVVEWAIKNENLALKTTGEVINPKFYGFAVKKGSNADLIKMFNDGLANIKANGKYDTILAKYGY